MLLLALVLWLGGGGCIGKRPANPAATQPATAIDPKVAEAWYWLDQPATAQVSGRDLAVLWETCEAVAREYLFRIDRRDHRAGMLSTEPMISKQFFEPWRKDAGTINDVKEASVATIRRTIYFQFTHNADETYTVVPKVVVERHSKVEGKHRTEEDMPSSYWYALRRDAVMEGKLAGSIRRKLEAQSPAT